MTVWFDSRTSDRPLRRRSIWFSMALFNTPIRALTMKMPPSVTSSITPRKAKPWSLPMVPASSVRIRLAQAASPNDKGSVPTSRASPAKVITAPETSTITSDSTNSMPISAGVPRDIKLSNWYRRRWPIVGFIKSPSRQRSELQGQYRQFATRIWILQLFCTALINSSAKG